MSRSSAELLNQSAELVDYNLFNSHSALVDALAHEGAAHDHPALAALGERLGSVTMFTLGDLANRNPPRLHAYERFGARLDTVEFHPAWHELLGRLVAEGLHTGPWARPRPGAHVARAAGYMLWAEIENGTQCPATMSYGGVPALARQGSTFEPWLRLLLSRTYDAFFVPAADKRGALRLLRLKDKLGNRSNASAEVEFEEAFGLLVAEEGRGIPTILEMGVYTRLDNAIGSAGLMRQCVAQAIHHARARRAFGRRLSEQPLMRNVLADLALECETAVMLTMRLARAFDAQHEEEGLLRRVLTPVVKYWVCKRAPAVCAETMEVLGGNGYCEDGPLARRLRESPLNSIWEGSGNIMCLDVLRALAREPRTLEALAALLGRASGRDARYDRYRDTLLADLAESVDGELRARDLTQRIALAAQASLLLAHGPEPSCAAFLASRIAAGPPAAFGTLPRGSDCAALTARVLAP
jgi:alkylation response protein AidB-like acyl-CoA dehydrogenase